jgi:hypothetical protein
MNMVKKCLYKSQGKFRLALIDMDLNAQVTGRLVSVSTIRITYDSKLGYTSTRSLSHVQTKHYLGARGYPRERLNERLP